MEKIQKFTAKINGKELIVETGKYASQASGACTVQYGGTVVLATAVKSDTIREGIDYFLQQWSNDSHWTGYRK